ncbi:MAG TPA: hypothetical protein VJ251_17505, partial [Stellaceae bacterium]|nr:hypothetical protein [Stellaceae bacterium]
MSNYHVRLSGGLATAFWRRAEGAATHPKSGSSVMRRWQQPQEQQSQGQMELLEMNETKSTLPAKIG